MATSEEARGTPDSTGKDAGKVMLMAPDGSDITGTLENIHGSEATLMTSPARRTDGTIRLAHSGETKVSWDTQETVRWRGKAVFVDDSGDFWHEGQLVPIDAPDTADVPVPLVLPGYNTLLALVHRIADAVADYRGDMQGDAVRALIENSGASV